MNNPEIDSDIPPGFVELLQNFTVSVLQSRPENIITYAIEYFTKLRDGVAQTTSAHPVLLLKCRSATEGEERHRIESREGSGVYPTSTSTTDEDTEELAEVIPVRNRRASVAAESFNPENENDEDDDEDIEIHQPVEKTEEQHRLLTKVCQKIMLFTHMEEDQLKRVIDVMSPRDVSPGEQIIVQGEEGDKFYVIESGIYDVSIKDNHGKEKIVSHYEHQGFFGELALIYSAPRSATVTAKSTGRIWSMERKDFRKLVLSYAARQRREFIQLLHSVQILQELSRYERMSLADALVKRSYDDGDCIIREGELGKEMFFVMSGIVRIQRKSPEGKQVNMRELGCGQYFGELALLSDQPRAASAFALGRVTLAVLGVESFERLLGPCMGIMRRNIANYSDNLTILGT